MAAPISGYSASSAMSLWNTANVNNVGNVDAFDFNKFSPIQLRKNAETKEVRGFTVQLHNIPEVLQWIAKEIERKYNVKVKNSDIPFSEEELKMVYHTLGAIPPEHLKGITTIVKNRSLQLSLQDATANVFAKMHKDRVYGAYDKENKRVFIFELDRPDQLATVLKHEIGHAVHSYNMAFEEFFVFMLKSGWNVACHEQQYIHGNSLYNMGLKKVVLSKEEALKLVPYFDWDSLRDKKDKYSKYVLDCPEDKRGSYIYKNPYETFAAFYEKTH